MHKMIKPCIFIIVLLITGLYGIVTSYAAAPVISGLDGDNPTVLIGTSRRYCRCHSRAF
jgi:hypothetical protein